MAEPSALPVPSGAPLRLTLRSDARLVRAAAAGDERAFAAIFERYHQELYRFCHALLRDPDEAQDALQATMASALRSLPGEERRIELRPWLYRVARNEAITIIRRRQPSAEIDDARLPAEPGSDTTAEARERLRTLVADLGTLPERQRSALVMRELSGLSHRQVAAALEISDGAARQAVYEARAALQELEEGRAMECDRIRKVISDGDRRMLRGRKVRAHLRGCSGCADFEAAIDARSRDLGLIAPPISAAAASGVLASVVGGGAAAGGGVAGGVLGGLGGGALGAKALGLIAVSAAVGVGAGTVAGVELPGIGSDESSEQRPAAPPAASGEAPAAQPRLGAGRRPAAAPGAGKAGKGKKAARSKRRRGGGHAHGQAPGIPAHASGNAYGQGGGNGRALGKAKNAPATPSPPGQANKAAGPPDHAKAGGAQKKPDRPPKPDK